MTNYCPDQKKFTPCQTNGQNDRYCIHEEGSDIAFVNSAMPLSRFLLSGASGMLGSALREAMAARQMAILQLVRHPPADHIHVQWDPGTPPAITQPDALEDLTAAIHFSGANLAAHRWTESYKQEILRSRIESTRALAATLARLRHPPKMLLVASAAGIYGDRGDELLDETSQPGTGFLADLCKQWEAASRPAAHVGIRVVHLRFGMVLSRGGGAFARMLPWFRLGLGSRFGSGNQYVSWIALSDAIAAILFLLESPSAAGAYNVTAPNPVTNAQFTRFLAGYLHRPAFLSAPAFALRLGLGEMADEALLSSTRAYPARLVGAGFQFAAPSLVHALPVILAPKR